MAEIVWFVNHGYKVFSYDCTGTHASEGKGTRGMAQSAFDLNAALSCIEEEGDLKTLPVLLFGHSWGAYAAAAVLAGLPGYRGIRIAAAVCVSGYNTPNGIVLEHAKKMIGPLAFLEFPFMALENFFRFGRASTVSAVQSINASSVPVLVIHGAGDKVVPFNSSSIIARQKRITNPEVEYYIRDKEGQNGHNDLFLSARAVNYALQMKADGSGEIDPLIMGELDEEFMTRVNVFFEKSLRKR